MASGVLLWVQVLLAAAVVAAVLYLVVTWLRRRTIAKGQSLVLCGMRRPGETRWHGGFLRYHTSRLDWFSLGGFSMRPRYSWQRELLELGTPTALEGRDKPTVLPGAVGISCRHRREQFELTMPYPEYTALRSWSESCPPGQNVNVA